MKYNNLALNPFKKGKKGEVEGVKKVEVEKDSQLQKALDLYHEILPKRKQEYYDGVFQFIPVPAISPGKIQGLLYHIIDNNLIREGEVFDLTSDSDITGRFISKLIQNSYNVGHNNFVLDVKESLIDLIGHGLHGNADDPIKLKVYGSLGGDFCRDSMNIVADVDGNIEGYDGRCGYKSQYSIFNIYGNSSGDLGLSSIKCAFNVDGNVTHTCGKSSIDSKFIINGNTGSHLGMHALKSTFFVKGNIDESNSLSPSNFRSKNSIYKVTNKDVYEENIPRVIKTKNLLQLVDNNGKVIDECKGDLYGK